MRDYLRRRYRDGAAPGHIWCGVSVEDRPGRARIRHLQAAPATIRFLSIEPLIGPVGRSSTWTGYAWVIVGGESGPNARPMKHDWVREIRDRCENADVPFFFKQWGGPTPKAGGRELEGVEHNAMPGSRTEGKRPCPSNGILTSLRRRSKSTARQNFASCGGACIDNLTSGRPTGVARSAGAYPVRTGPFLSRRAGQILRSPQRGGVADPRPPAARQVTCISPGFLPPMGTRFLRSGSPRSS